jgi:beta-glucanase (GH16 family)
MTDRTFRVVTAAGLCALFFAAATPLSVLAVAQTAPAETTEQYMPALDEGMAWRLAWADEFDGAEVDRSKWEILGDSRRRDGYWVREDSYLDGKGNLIIRTKKDGDRYTSGSVRTRGRFEAS